VVSIEPRRRGLVGACKNARREWNPARQPEPGTSKWNKIEHRLLNWRGRPLTSHEVIVQTIAATTTSGGLSVHADSTPRSTRPAPQPVDTPETGSINLSRALSLGNSSGWSKPTLGKPCSSSRAGSYSPRYPKNITLDSAISQAVDRRDGCQIARSSGYGHSVYRLPPVPVPDEGRGESRRLPLG